MPAHTSYAPSVDIPAAFESRNIFGTGIQTRINNDGGAFNFLTWNHSQLSSGTTEVTNGIPADHTNGIFLMTPRGAGVGTLSFTVTMNGFLVVSSDPTDGRNFDWLFIDVLT